MVRQKKSKILVIVGPNASGKSALAVLLAKKFGGEIVSADSRQVYRGLNIGTGKITKRDTQGVPHHLLDVAHPKQVYTAVDFKRDGRKIIRYIVRNKKLPIVVGGTGFYISVLLGETTLPPVKPNKKLRARLEKRDAAMLHALLHALDPARATTIDPHNKHRLMRAIEIAKAVGYMPTYQSARAYNVLKIGVKHTDTELQKRIHERLRARMRRGMIAEARRLHESGLSYQRMRALGLEYRYMADFLQEKISKEELVDVLKHKIWQYAKRQMTWFKRDEDTRWFNLRQQKQIENVVEKFLRDSSCGR